MLGKKSRFLRALLVLLVFCIFVLLFIPFNLHLMSSTSTNHKDQPLIIAHRGASGYAPENTLAAIDLAMSSDAQMIEIDVHLSKDGHVIVIHDETVDRTTNGSGKVNEMTLDELQQLDAGSWFSDEFAGERLPTLQEVMSLIDGDKKLLIEIKSGIKTHQEIDRKVAEAIINADALNWCIVQSFDTPTLKEFNRNWPQITLHKLIVFKFRFLPLAFDGDITSFSAKKYSYVDAVNPHFKFVNRRFVKNMHQAGLQVNVWGGNSPDSYDQIRHLPVDGWITDFPLLQ
jgi:glycerophosphoryl diester phosphodiesterase